MDGNQPRTGLVLLVSATALLIAGCRWNAWRGPQEADVAPLHEIRLRDDLWSIRPYFPDFEVLVQAEAEKSEGVPGPARIECLRREGDDGLDVDVILLADVDLAREEFESQCMLWRREDHGPYETGGQGDDRYFVSGVHEAVTHDSWFGSGGMGYYCSQVVFQKGQVVLLIRERSPSRAADKNAVILEIAAALEPLEQRPGAAERADISEVVFRHMFAHAEDWDLEVSVRILHLEGPHPAGPSFLRRFWGEHPPVRADGSGDRCLLYVIDEIAWDGSDTALVRCHVSWHPLAARGYDYHLERGPKG